MAKVNANERPELTVKLTRVSGESLVAEYHRPGYSQVACTQPKSIRSFGQGITYRNQSGIEAVNALLDAGDQKELERGLSGERGRAIGQLMFELLFPEEVIWRKLLQGLLGAATPEMTSPTKDAVRLRIWTEDPALMALPWRMAQRNGLWLLNSGWTFELVQEAKAAKLLELSALCPILCVVPAYQVGRDLSGDLHLLELKERLSKIKPLEARLRPDAFRLVRSVSELSDALGTFRPEILYYFGHGVIEDGAACLDFGERCGGLCLFSDLKRWMGSRFPRIVFLNGCMTGATGHTAAGPQLAPDVPLVIASRTTAFTLHARETALRWFQRTLGDGMDPVIAIHRLEPGYSQRDFQWTTHAVHSAYRDARLGAQSPEVYDSAGSHRLNRDSPRARVVKHIAELRDHPSRRVEAVVAYGRPGNLIHAFCNQALDEIELHGGVHYQCIPLKLPEPARPGADDYLELLSTEVLTQLGAGDQDSLTQVLRRAFGDTPRPGMVWLDFGVIRQTADNAATLPLQEWLTYCHDTLGILKLDFSLVAFLAVETDVPRELEREVRKQRVKIASDRFRCSLLDELEPVKYDELYDYLSDPRHCPTNYAAEATDLIHEATDGHYEQTVELIREGQRGWAKLLGRLRREKE